MPRAASAKNLDALRVYEDFYSTLKNAARPPSLPDIATFAEDPRFCGKKLFPRQRTLLRLMYADVEHMTPYDYDVIEEWRSNFYFGQDRVGVAPDIWDRLKWVKDNGYPHFREIEFIGGRRGGKGHLGGIVGAYQSFKLISLDNPQWHYGIDLSKDLYTFIVATNQAQARDYQFKDIAETISSAPCFEKFISTNKSLWLSLRTPADIRRIAEFERRKVTMEREVASLRFVALSSNSRAGRGAASFSLFFDEMAHMLTGTEGPQTAEEVYKALTPALGQMGKDALIYIPTSPYSKVGAAHTIYQDALRVTEDGKPENPDILMVQLPSWGGYVDWDNPKVVAPGTFRRAFEVYDDAAKRVEARDPESFKVEKRAQWAEVINAYLNPKMVDRMFAPIVIPEVGTRVLENETPGVMRWVYRGHADPSESQANFAFAIGHTEPFREVMVNDETGEEFEEVIAHVVFDWLHVWKPTDYLDHQIDYLEVEKELVGVITQFRTLKNFSYDQYGGFVTVPYLKSHLRKVRHEARVHQVTFTEKSNHIRAERFKSALGMGWIHAPKDGFAADGESLLEQELKFLQTKNGRVVRQTIGPVTTKDLADACRADHEVMTIDGWKLIPSITRDDLVATRSPEGVLEYQHPTFILRKPHVDGLYTLDDTHLNFSVTPKHRMLLSNKDGASPRYQLMKDMAEPSYIPKVASTPSIPSQWIELPTHQLPPALDQKIPAGGLCQCGCDQSTRLAKRTRGDRGDVKGQPMRFLPRHHLVKWTEDQDAYLAAHYEDAPMVDLVAVLGKSNWSIYNRADKVLGLERGQIGDRWGDRPEPLPKTRLEDFAAFVGIWLAEGKKIVPGKQGFAVSLTQTKPKGIEWIDALFERLGWTYQRSLRSNGETEWVVKSRELQDYLYALQDGHELSIPKEAFVEWGRESQEALLEGMLVGDGTWSKQVDRFVAYDTTSRRLADDVQRLLVHVGLSGRIKKVRDKGDRCTGFQGEYYAQHDGWKVCITVSPAARLDPTQVRFEPFEGDVYCIMVPNSNFYTRRNGVPMWIGNCVMEVSSELLSDQIDRVERNRKLSGARLAAGAPGGYHTGMESAPQPGSARDKLRGLGQSRLRRPQA